jgi:hypothetical protein
MSTILTGSDLTVQNVSLSQQLAQQIDAIASERHVSRHRAILDLLQDGILAYAQRRAAFLELADRFQKSTDPTETERLGQELERLTFGS